MQSLDCSRRARTVRAGSDEAGFGLDCDGEPAPEDANPRRGASSEPSACKRHPSNEDACCDQGEDRAQSVHELYSRACALQPGDAGACPGLAVRQRRSDLRSEEHTSELQSLMRLSYAVFCLTK